MEGKHRTSPRLLYLYIPSDIIRGWYIISCGIHLGNDNVGIIRELQSDYRRWLESQYYAPRGGFVSLFEVLCEKIAPLIAKQLAEGKIHCATNNFFKKKKIQIIAKLSPTQEIIYLCLYSHTYLASQPCITALKLANNF